MFDFLSIKKAINGLSKQIKNLRATIEEKKREREDLQTLPASREELVRVLHEWVEDSANRYVGCLGKSWGYIIKNPLGCDKNSAHFSALTATRSGPTNQIQQDALIFFLKDLIKDGIERAVDMIDYPKDTGPSVEIRNSRIEILDKEISKLEEEEDGLVAEAESAGVHIDRVDPVSVKHRMSSGVSIRGGVDHRALARKDQNKRIRDETKAKKSLSS